jgi:hypothetical protein
MGLPFLRQPKVPAPSAPPPPQQPELKGAVVKEDTLAVSQRLRKRASRSQFRFLGAESGGSGAGPASSNGVSLK